MFHTFQFALWVMKLKRVPRSGPETVARLQRRRLRRLVRLAVDWAPFYRDKYRGLDPDRFELADLAPTNKAELMTHFDRVVLATHADQALTLLADADGEERDVLGSFRYSRNLAILHTDARFMPVRPRAWSSWNFIGERDAPSGACVTYWMNRLQSIAGANLFVTLNPAQPPHAGTLLHSEIYEHPMFDERAIRAQSRLWSLQGRGNVWFCGAYFGAGFHEDGLQAGLAVAEALGGVRRPWTVADESGRIQITRRRDAATLETA